MELKEFKIRLAELGYRFEKHPRFSLDTTSNGEKGWVTPCIVEADTGISFAHYKDARRDSNFKALQELRDRVVTHKGYEVWV